MIDLGTSQYKVTVWVSSVSSHNPGFVFFIIFVRKDLVEQLDAGKLIDIRILLNAIPEGLFQNNIFV